MKPIVIGRIVATNHPLYLDLDKLKHLLCTASSGGGKSNTVRVILERSHGICPQYVLDVEGEYATLRDHGDYVLVAGQNGDRRIDNRETVLLTRRAVEANFDIIADLSEVRHLDQHRYVMLAQEAFTNLPRDLWGPRLITIDEAHKFCPESGKQKETSVAKEATIDTATRGRKREHKCIFATQRIAKFSKDAAAECNDKLVGLANLADDRKRGVEELGVPADQKKAMELALGRMEPGQFYAIGPAFGLTEVTLVQIAKAKTEPPPTGKAARKAPAQRTSVERILKQLGDLPAQAEEEATSLADAKAQVKRLTAENKRLQAGAPVATRTVEVEKIVEKPVPYIPRQLREPVMLAANTIAKAAETIREAFADAEKSDQQFKVVNFPGPRPPSKEQVTAARLELSMAVGKGPKAPAAAVTAPTPPEGAEGLTGPMQRILDGLANLEALGVNEVELAQVTLLAGYGHPKSSGFVKAFGQASTAGLVERERGLVKLTDAGRRLATPVSVPLSTEELQSRVFKVLDPVHERLLRPLIDANGGWVDLEAVMRAADYEHPKSSGFVKAMSRLSSLGLIEKERGQVRATKHLFLEA